ncbi:hypothetical protein [Planomonospora venezuelensis]|uniref:GNAT superfamily N-acetyltransferase n=1 Tax=Planomonospora venezuelensis TaxID=1999 RepID=A0A841DCD8_PLAVE|nr:hypothetical protein [Planomonospora venezuelensis]MBB5965958.1 GNAT superfamily N-acetyltransferase [Planomonospora venezuelensis]GIN01288.1 hypothetical protein Pve01_29460 [Planomonospora venezuelensis]
MNPVGGDREPAGDLRRPGAGNGKGVREAPPAAPAARGLGAGRVLLRRCLAETRAAGLVRAQISWVGPLGFSSRAVGARAERVFWLYRRDLR